MDKDSVITRSTKKRAQESARKAVGEIPTACELCGVTVAQLKLEDMRNTELFGIPFRRSRFIVGHHWRGYDYPTDVWWICYRCNWKLHGQHDGSIGKDEARVLVANSILKPV